MSRGPTTHSLGRLALAITLGAGVLQTPRAAAAQGPVFSTGVDAAGVVLGSGVADPHWTFVKAPPTSTSGSAVTLTPAGFFNGGGGFGPYVPNTASARWVSTAQDGGAN